MKKIVMKAVQEEKDNGKDGKNFAGENRDVGGTSLTVGISGDSRDKVVISEAIEKSPVECPTTKKDDEYRAQDDDSEKGEQLIEKEEMLLEKGELLSHKEEHLQLKELSTEKEQLPEMEALFLKKGKQFGYSGDGSEKGRECLSLETELIRPGIENVPSSNTNISEYNKFYAQDKETESDSCRLILLSDDILSTIPPGSEPEVCAVVNPCYAKSTKNQAQVEILEKENVDDTESYLEEPSLWSSSESSYSDDSYNSSSDDTCPDLIKDTAKREPIMQSHFSTIDEIILHKLLQADSLPHVDCGVESFEECSRNITELHDGENELSTVDLISLKVDQWYRERQQFDADSCLG